MGAPWPLLLALLPVAYFVVPLTFTYLAAILGWYIRHRTGQEHRRQLLLAKTEREEQQSALQQSKKAVLEDGDWEKVDLLGTGSATNGGPASSQWKGIVGFFHPFCNDGGGGERVLWTAIMANQQRWPEATCVVYTGDEDIDKDDALKRVEHLFNIYLHAPTIHFMILTTRHWVLSQTWPRFTLLGQSIGSLILGWDAFNMIVPDIFIDTMGYAFSIALCNLLFPSVPTAAYVHYPTISTDMLGSLNKAGQGMNAGSGSGIKGTAKGWYWHLFAGLYSWAGGSVDVVMTNSSWTQHHIESLWKNSRLKQNRKSKISIVFPPVPFGNIERGVAVSAESERSRGPFLLYIAQFRPEKNHKLILHAFGSLLSSNRLDVSKRPKLVLMGSERECDKKRIYELKLLANELQLKDNVEFIFNFKEEQKLEWLRKSSVGVNAMWNEHFGIGIVEYQAAGLISVVNDSGGPKQDIVVDLGDGPTGFHATSQDEYANAFVTALNLGRNETLAMRHRARESARRFTEEVFASQWLQNMETLIEMKESKSGPI